MKGVSRSAGARFCSAATASLGLPSLRAAVASKRLAPECPGFVARISVALRAAAFPQRLYPGQVSEIAPRAVRGGTAAFPTNIVEVRLQVENPAGELRPGVSGWTRIDCGRRPLGSILLRRVSRYLRGEVWSWC